MDNLSSVRFGRGREGRKLWVGCLSLDGCFKAFSASSPVLRDAIVECMNKEHQKGFVNGTNCGFDVVSMNESTLNANLCRSKPPM